jgi:glycosyltransferase involved in cell wall biosynthesis
VKILFSTYSTAFQNPGGGENVMAHLREELGRLGCQVDLFDSVACNLADYQVFHHFSLFEPERLSHFKRICPRTPLLVTPTVHIHRKAFGAMRWRLHLLGLHWQNFSMGAPRDSLAAPDLYLAATENEAGILRDYYGFPASRVSILPNGVAIDFAGNSPALFRETTGIRGPFVLHTGRFHPVKNQRTLIEACARRGIAAVFIGGPDVGFQRYREDCERRAQELERMDATGRTRFHFFGHQPFGSDFLRSAYAAAAVFALPSEFETFGISALEAMVAGRALVISSAVAEHSLFPRARFVPPHDVAGWAAALGDSLENPVATPEEEIRVALDRYSWKNIASRLLAHYRNASSHSGSS